MQDENLDTFFVFSTAIFPVLNAKVSLILATILSDPSGRSTFFIKKKLFTELLSSV